MALSELSQLLARRVSRTSDLKTIGLPTSGLSPFFACAADSTGVATTNPAGVPTDLTLTFAASRCSQSTGGIGQVTSGTIRIQDLGGQYAARVTYTNLISSLTTPGGEIRTTVNGTVEIRGLSPTTGRIDQRYTDVQESVSAASVVRTARIRSLAFTYTDTAGVPPPLFNLRPPSRTSYAGTLIVRAERDRIDSLHMVITTPVELQPDLRCVLSGYRAGEIRAEVTGTGKLSVGLKYSCR